MTGAVISATSDSGLRTLMADNSTAVVYFWGTWCAPCRQLGPVVETVASTNPNLAIIKAQDDHVPEVLGELTSKLGISSLPILAFYKDGKQVAVVTGFRNKHQLQHDIEENLAA